MNKKNIKKDIIPKESSNSNVELPQKEINSNEQPNRTNPDNYNLTVVLANLSQSTNREERLTVIKEIGEENKRRFLYFTARRNQNFGFKIFLLIILVGLVVFFSLMKQFEILKELIVIGLTAVGGAGFYIIYNKIKKD